MNNDFISDLSPVQKLRLIEDLWDELAALPDEIPIHEWQLRELARRKARLQSDPASSLSWNEVKRRVRRKRVE